MRSCWADCEGAATGTAAKKHLLLQPATIRQPPLPLQTAPVSEQQTATNHHLLLSQLAPGPAQETAAILQQPATVPAPSLEATL